MNKKTTSTSTSSSNSHLLIKHVKTEATPIKKSIPLKKDNSYASKNTTIKKPQAQKLITEPSSIIQTTRCTTAKRFHKEKSDNELKNKQTTTMNNIKEKQTMDKFEKIINHKDQVINNKNLRIKQLESEAKELKSQIEKYKLQIKKLDTELEVNRKSLYLLADKLVGNYIVSQTVKDNTDENDSDYPDPDTMTYEELLELENKMGYVSKGLKKEVIDAIPVMTFRKEEHIGKEDIKCLICQFDFEEGNTLRIIKCNHLFHKDCIDKWLNDEKVCPNCKCEV